MKIKSVNWDISLRLTDKNENNEWHVNECYDG